MIHEDSKQLRKTGFRMQTARNSDQSCTIFRHTPVDELHSIENKDDRDSKNVLTQKL